MTPLDAATLRAHPAPHLPKGYKHTEAGMIPETWDVFPLSELLAFQNGVNADKQNYGHGIPFANVLEVITHTHLTAASIPGRVQLARQRQEGYSVKSGDILFNRTSETQDEIGLASVYVGDEPIVFGGFVIRGRPVSDQLHRRYAGWGLRGPTVRDQIIARGQGAIRANIGQADLRTVIVPLPPLAEQEAIAEALSDADALIDRLQSLIAKKRAIRQGAMQELLTGQRRLVTSNAKIKSTPIGLLPDDWDCERIDAIADIATGGRNTQDRVEDGAYPFFVRSQIVERINTYAFDGEAVLTAGDGVGTGKVFHYINGKFDTHQRVYRITHFVKRLNGYFFYLYFSNHFYDRIMQMTAKSSVDSVRREMIAGMLVPVPRSREEQDAIAACIGHMDEGVRSLEDQLAKARQIKQGMMQELLTGRIRLV